MLNSLLLTLFAPLLWLATVLLPASQTPKTPPIITGADQTEQYLSYLQGKRVGVLANPTTIIGRRHLVDSLKGRGINIVKVFGPEHGFRGNASAGIKVKNEVDAATGIPIISLYGPKRKPSAEDLADVDVMLFDVQDVGVRFYTYINVLRDIMEACADNNKELLILDRPNPNGYLIDGPTLDMQYKSGIGQFPIPIAHGLTIAEFAQMINGEGWLPDKRTCKLRIVKVKNYRHDLEYTLPVKPSPNLNTQQSVLLYPSVCLFEGAYINLGRGTQFPFTVLGSPHLKGKYPFSFTPTSIKGMSETPLFMDQLCYGLDLRRFDARQLRTSGRIRIEWMLELYRASPNKAQFFDRTLSKEMGDINKLAGVAEFRQQIEAGKSAQEIRASWEPQLSQYKQRRLKYLLYP
ncbi:exo-beta-N-acetylmuramidase NamZ family protein [Hymenobacter sp. HD11105]